MELNWKCESFIRKRSMFNTIIILRNGQLFWAHSSSGDILESFRIPPFPSAKGAKLVAQQEPGTLTGVNLAPAHVETMQEALRLLPQGKWASPALNTILHERASCFSADCQASPVWPTRTGGPGSSGVGFRSTLLFYSSIGSLINEPWNGSQETVPSSLSFASSAVIYWSFY